MKRIKLTIANLSTQKYFFGEYFIILNKLKKSKNSVNFFLCEHLSTSLNTSSAEHEKRSHNKAISYDAYQLQYKEWPKQYEKDIKYSEQLIRFLSFFFLVSDTRL